MRPRFVLYGHFESGNVYKVALMLSLSGGSYEYVHVPMFDGGTRTPEFLAKNRFGEVPVLVDTARDDLTIAQSGAILWHLARELSRFGPQGGDDELRILEWLLWENHRLLPGVARLRSLKRFSRTPPAPALLTAVEGWAVAALDVLERELSARDFLVGAGPTIADIQICGYMFFLDEAGLEEGRWPHVVAWRDRIAALPGFAPPRELLPRE